MRRIVAAMLRRIARRLDPSPNVTVNITSSNDLNGIAHQLATVTRTMTR
jgi:plasmid maintenance system antidote protein VapI